MSKIYEEHIVRRYCVECMGEPCDVMSNECRGVFCDYKDVPAIVDREMVDVYVYVKGMQRYIFPFSCGCPRDDVILHQTWNDKKVEKLEKYIKVEFPDIDFNKEHFKYEMKRFGKWESED